MKESTHYKYAVSIVNKLTKHKEIIITSFAEASPYKIVELNTALQIIKAELKIVQEFMYEVCTPEEITHIVNGIPFEKPYTWSNSIIPIRDVLPKDKYCHHTDWVSDAKLQALMPNKKF